MKKYQYNIDNKFVRYWTRSLIMGTCENDDGAILYSSV